MEELDTSHQVIVLAEVVHRVLHEHDLTKKISNFFEKNRINLKSMNANFEIFLIEFSITTEKLTITKH